MVKGNFLNHHVVSQNCDTNNHFIELSGSDTFAKLFLGLTGSDFKQYWNFFGIYCNI